MKRLVIPVRPETDWQAPDIDRIVAVCAAAGYTVTRPAARWAYGECSELEYCRGWLTGVGSMDDAELVAIMRHYLDAEEIPDATPGSMPAKVDRFIAEYKQARANDIRELCERMLASLRANGRLVDTPEDTPHA